MTDDDVSRGVGQRNLLTGEPFEALDSLFRIESVVAPLPTGADGATELWKLNHYHGGLAGWHADQGHSPSGGAERDATPEWELHNLHADPEERHNLAMVDVEHLRAMQAVLDRQRDEKRLLPHPPR